MIVSVHFSPRVARRPSQQRGSALAFLMVLLLGIALLAMYANRSAILENRLARGARDYQIAKDAAEAAVADIVNAIGASNGKVFVAEFTKFGNDGQPQVGTCAAGNSGNASVSGTQAAGGTATPGLVRFDGCGYSGGFWQALTLSQIEAIAAPIGAVTGDTTSSYANTAAIQANAVHSYKSPRVLIEPVFDTQTGAAAETGVSAANPSGTPAIFAFRITAIGYGPTSDTVVVLQETWRPPA